ncbi:MAG: SMC-Scp complex subunit ScpB [candidate division Zixibacteria bacterium]|nr:SMC-Scp complex subunit ScpB [candidate division Zixibacteria bacterium]
MSDESESSGYTVEEINLVEAVIFSAPKPVTVGELKKVLTSRHRGGVRGIVERLNQKYIANHHSFRIREIAGGYQFHLSEDYSLQVERYFSKRRKRRLTQAGLETLAIVAYKQPVTKGEIEKIRGVASDGVLQTLLERKLVKPAGRADRIGKPLLYATTPDFLEYFGISGLEQLPKLEEIMPKPPNGAAQESLAFDLQQPEPSQSTE